jgi:hypothetical protein
MYLEPMIDDLFMACYADCIFNEDHFPVFWENFHNNSEYQKINWDDKSIISSDPRTQETELQVEKIMNLQNAANNLSDEFINYNGVIKSWNPAVNALKRVEVSKKTTPVPSTKKRGRTKTTRKETASEKRQRKGKSKAPRKSKNMIQPKVEWHHTNTNDPQSNSWALYINETRISEIPDNLVLGNHETSKGIEEFFINYTSSGEVYDHNTTIANLCFSTVIVENFLNDLDPKTMSECKKRSDWNKGKEAIETDLTHLRKERCSHKWYLHLPEPFLLGSSGFSFKEKWR